MTTQTIPLTAEARVAAGAAYLDAEVPDWRERVRSFEGAPVVSSVTDCVLGRLAVSLDYVADVRRWMSCVCCLPNGFQEFKRYHKLTDSDIVDMGFDVRYGDATYDHLQAAWNAELAA